MVQNGCLIDKVEKMLRTKGYSYFTKHTDFREGNKFIDLYTFKDDYVLLFKFEGDSNNLEKVSDKELNFRDSKSYDLNNKRLFRFGVYDSSESKSADFKIVNLKNYA